MNNNDSDIIYYNITMTCQVALSRTLAKFEEMRTTPILENPSDYYLSIVRFALDGRSIPIMIMPVIPNPGNPSDVNYTPFSVSLQYGGINYTTQLVFVPEVSTYTPQPPTASSQDLTNEYYYIYSYQTLVNMINTAFENSFNALAAANPGLVPTVRAPYIIFDRSSSNFGIVVQNIENPLLPGTNVYLNQFNISGIPLVGSSQVAGTINIFMNSRIYAYFDSIESYKYITDPILTDLILIRDLKNNYYYPPQNDANTTATQTPINFVDTNVTYTIAPDYFLIKQQYDMIGTWNSLSGIVFLTSTLPVQYEYLPSSTVQSTNNASSTFRPILTDFVPNLQKIGDARTKLIYYPSGPYRLINLGSNDPLRKIDLQVFWTDQYNNSYPLYVSCTQSDTVKLMFIKKSLINNTLMLKY